MYKIITICGSSKFKATINHWNGVLTLRGHIVFSLGCFGHADKLQLTKTQKDRLDRIHIEKIRRSDAIFVVNEGGYIGSSTSNEIKVAEVLKIHVFLMTRVQDRIAESRRFPFGL